MPTRFSPPKSGRRGSKSWSPTSPRSRSTPSSTPPTPRCWAAAVSMARSIAPPDEKLLKECKTLGGCATGSAKITRGYKLPAKHVIHAVGPVWSGGKRGEPDLLASCYRTALELAAEHESASIAFPAISTGVYRFPADLAARDRGRHGGVGNFRQPRAGSSAWCSAAFRRNRRSTTRMRLRNWDWPEAYHSSCPASCRSIHVLRFIT